MATFQNATRSMHGLQNVKYLSFLRKIKQTGNKRHIKSEELKYSQPLRRGKPKPENTSNLVAANLTAAQVLNQP